MKSNETLSDAESGPLPEQCDSTQTNDPNPATRSKHMILHDIPSNSGLCDTKLLHNDASDFDLKYRNHSGNRSKPCGTNLTHNRSVRGLWLRGSVYQFRVRVPADLAGVVGRNHVGFRCDKSSSGNSMALIASNSTRGW